MKKGIVHRRGENIFSQRRHCQDKAYMKDIHVHYSEDLSFAVNCISDTQSIRWNEFKLTFESMDGKSLNVHNCLLEVSFIVSNTCFIFIDMLLLFCSYSVLCANTY